MKGKRGKTCEFCLFPSGVAELIHSTPGEEQEGRGRGEGKEKETSRGRRQGAYMEEDKGKKKDNNGYVMIRLHLDKQGRGRMGERIGEGRV